MLDSLIASGTFATEETLAALLSHLRIHSGISVEEIQNQVEVALMAEHYYTVAKNYMIYRYRTHQPQVFLRRVYQHGFHGLLYVVRRLRYARVHMVEAAEFLGIPINDNPRYANTACNDCGHIDKLMQIRIEKRRISCVSQKKAVPLHSVLEKGTKS